MTKAICKKTGEKVNKKHCSYCAGYVASEKKADTCKDLQLVEYKK